jgi:hypothetical protein
MNESQSQARKLCKETAPATGEAGAVVQCAGREEEEADTPMILVIGRPISHYIMV